MLGNRCWCFFAGLVVNYFDVSGGDGDDTVACVLNVKNEAVFVNWEVNIVVDWDAAEAMADNFVVKASRVLGNINSRFLVWAITHNECGDIR